MLLVKYIIFFKALKFYKKELSVPKILSSIFFISFLSLSSNNIEYLTNFQLILLFIEVFNFFE